MFLNFSIERTFPEKWRWAGTVMAVIGHGAIVMGAVMVVAVTPVKPPQPLPIALSERMLPAAPAVVTAPPAPQPESEPKPLPRVPGPHPKPVVQKTAPRPIAPTETAPTIETPPVVGTLSPTPAAPPPAALPLTEARFDAAYLNNPKPDYPVISRRMHETGRVLLRVRVAEDGAALEVTLKNSSGSPRLDEAALDTVRHWKFAPARQGATAVVSWVIVPIDFSLSQD